MTRQHDLILILLAERGGNRLGRQQVQRVDGGRLELGVVQVEAARGVVAGVHQQGRRRDRESVSCSTRSSTSRSKPVPSPVPCRL